VYEQKVAEKMRAKLKVVDDQTDQRHKENMKRLHIGEFFLGGSFNLLAKKNG
jgi:hypothetical protein